MAPFATNIQFQCKDEIFGFCGFVGRGVLFSVLSCTSEPDPQIRVIINDGVVPLYGVEGCPDDKSGMCPVETFARAQQKLLDNVDWDWACHGNWEVGEGTDWETVTGDPPAKLF